MGQAKQRGSQADRIAQAKARTEAMKLEYIIAMDEAMGVEAKAGAQAIRPKLNG